MGKSNYEKRIDKIWDTVIECFAYLKMVEYDKLLLSVSELYVNSIILGVRAAVTELGVSNATTEVWEVIYTALSAWKMGDTDAAARGLTAPWMKYVFDGVIGVLSQEEAEC